MIFRIWIKPYLEVVWNVIQVRFLQLHLNLDTLAAQIRFQMVFCVTFNATHNDNVKTSDRNAEEDSYSDYSMERHYICDPGLQNQS